jgi:hypothetical protein
MSRRWLIVLGVQVLGACGGGEPPVSDPSRPDLGTRVDAIQSPDAARDATVAPDAGVAPDAAAAPLDGPPVAVDAGVSVCPPAAIDLTFTDPYESGVLAGLTGETEIEPGLKLFNRGTPENRDAARRYLETSLRALGLNAMAQPYGTGTNLMARVESTTGGNEHVVLGAHFDTVARTAGANDNGTGVALVLAVGRVLTQLPCRSRTVVLAFFDEEEVGLVGARQFARQLAADKLAVHSVHTVDQVGWDSNEDRLIELELPTPALRQLYETARAELGLAFPIVATNTTSSDHNAFRPTWPVTGVTEGYRSGDTSPYRHKPADTFATVNLPYLRSASALVGRVIADLLR